MDRRVTSPMSYVLIKMSYVLKKILLLVFLFVFFLTAAHFQPAGR